MKDVQTENGYFSVALEIQDALCQFRIPGEVRQIVDAVIRKTWGWHKKEDEISNSQFVAITGMNKSNAHRALAKAIQHRLVVVKNDNKLSFNKHYDEWIVFEKVVKKATTVVKSDLEVVKDDNEKLSKVTYTINNKNNKQKITNTNVLEPKAEYGNSDINEIINYGNIILKIWKDDRRAIHNLLRLKKLEEIKPELSNVERVKALIDLVAVSRKDQYAPRISGYSQLLKRWPDLLEWLGRKKGNNGSTVAEIR